MDPGNSETALKLGRKVLGQNLATAKRQPAPGRGNLGNTDHLRSERMAVKSWAEFSEERGHFLGRQENFRRLSKLVQLRESDLLGKQADPGLTGEEMKHLAAAQSRLEAWQPPRCRDKAMKQAAQSV